MVRRGSTPMALRIRAASIITAQPMALSVAPRPGMPRIEVAPEHDDFVGFVRSRNLGNDVVGRSTFRVKVVDDIDLELDRTVFQEPRDSAVVFVA